MSETEGISDEEIKSPSDSLVNDIKRRKESQAKDHQKRAEARTKSKDDGKTKASAERRSNLDEKTKKKNILIDPETSEATKRSLQPKSGRKKDTSLFKWAKGWFNSDSSSAGSSQLSEKQAKGKVKAYSPESEKTSSHKDLGSSKDQDNSNSEVLIVDVIHPPKELKNEVGVTSFPKTRWVEVTLRGTDDERVLPEKHQPEVFTFQSNHGSRAKLGTHLTQAHEDISPKVSPKETTVSRKPSLLVKLADIVVDVSGASESTESKSVKSVQAKPKEKPKELKSKSIENIFVAISGAESPTESFQTEASEVKRNPSASSEATPRGPPSPDYLSPVFPPEISSLTVVTDFELTPNPRVTSVLSLNAGPEEALHITDSFPVWMFLPLLISLVTYAVDLCSDVSVAVVHYHRRDYWYFGWTVVFIIIPGIMISVISCLWYSSDAKLKNPEKVAPPLSRVSTWTRTMYLVMQLGIFVRLLDCLRYAFIVRRAKTEETRRRYYRYLVFGEMDAVMLRLFEAFTEAGPQLVLQIYILAKQYDPNGTIKWTSPVLQVITCMASLFSMAWSLVNCNRLLRISLPSKMNMNWMGVFFQFIWRFCTIAARVLALALSASVCLLLTLVVVGIHVVVMFIWIISMKTNFFDNKCHERFYNAIVALMFTFDYFNPVDTPTRLRYMVYYTIIFIQNTILILVWYFLCDYNAWYRVPAVFGQFVAFFVGIIFMVMYYLLLHPNNLVKNKTFAFKMRHLKVTSVRLRKHSSL